MIGHRPTFARRRGSVIVYSIFTLLALLTFSALAVDWGRAQLTKTELQSAADAAARYGVVGLKTSPATAISQAQWAASLNKANGSSVVLDVSDIEFGTWDPGSQTFEPLTIANQNSATSIRVTVRRSQATGNPIVATFGTWLGKSTMDVTATAIATRGTIVTNSVDAKACPWLAGMPSGSTVAPYGGNSQGCVAPENSPSPVSTLSISAGRSFYFRQTSGTTSYSNASNYGPDGQADWIVRQEPTNGINSTSAPLNCLVGIFLDDNAPDSSAMQAELDFSTVTSRNFTSLSPGLKQVFFIGDGLDDSGNLQQFVAPTGATRLYLAIMDEKGWWWDNTGQLQTTMMDDNVQLVK